MITDAAQWFASLSPKGGGNQPAQIISGNIAKLTTGEVMNAVLQKTDKTNTFRVNLQGESLTVKGLPASLAGKNVAFMIHKTFSKGLIQTELHWSPLSRGKQANSAAKAESSLLSQSLKKTQQAVILSKFPTAIQDGKPFSARIDKLEGSRMHLSLLQNEGKQINPQTRQVLITSQIIAAKTGQTISARLQQSTSADQKPLLEIQTLNIKPPQMATAKSAPINQQQALDVINHKMAAGESTLAVVVKRLNSDNVQLKIHGVTIESPAPTHIKAGDALEIKMLKAPAQFQVVQVHKNISQKALDLVQQRLSATTPVSQNLAVIRNILPNLTNSENLEIRGPTTQLESWMRASESSRDFPINGERLTQLIRDSGMQLEGKLQALVHKAGQNPASIQQDLKAILMQIAGDEGKGKAHSPELIRVLSEASQQSVSRIELGQALNLLANLQGEAIRIELPMLVGQQLINVQLAVQQNSSQQQQSEQHQESDQCYNVLFALELSKLGQLRVDANITDQSVHARIYNDKPEVRHFLQQHIQTLQERLQALGYKEVYLIASPAQPEAEKQEAFNQLTSMRPVSFNMLDMLV